MDALGASLLMWGAPAWAVKNYPFRSTFIIESQ
jgi:hypothetical protein